MSSKPFETSLQDSSQHLLVKPTQKPKNFSNYDEINNLDQDNIDHNETKKEYHGLSFKDEQNTSSSNVGLDPRKISICPQFNKNVNYYHEFWRMYLQNEVVISQMKEYVTQTKEIQARITHLENLCSELESGILSDHKKETKKKNRRTANEIEKTHICPYEGCNKLYGSDVSLNLHIKLKHNGGNKTEREKLARTIFLAKLNGDKVPDISLNLPPGYLENIDTTHQSKEKDGSNKGTKSNKELSIKSSINNSKDEIKLENKKEDSS